MVRDVQVYDITMPTCSPRRHLALLALMTVASTFASGAVVACADPQGDEVAGWDDELNEASNRIVLHVANTLSEDELDLDVGLGETAAREVVERRPFESVTVLRAILNVSQVKLLLRYGQAHANDGSAPAPGDGDAAADAGSAGPPRFLSMACSELYDSSHPRAMDLAWYPPEAMRFDGNGDRLYGVNIPSDAWTLTVTDSKVAGQASFSHGGRNLTASFDVARQRRQGWFEYDGERFPMKCFSIRTTAWESRVGQ